MTPLQMIEEWRKGCSCATVGHPEQCLECTRGLIDALEEHLRNREHPESDEETMIGKQAITIDVDDIMIDDHDCALIVCAQTGILYTAQCGGLACTHPEVEGFFLPLWDIAPQINDHKLGCSDLTKTHPGIDRPDLRKGLAETIDSTLRSPELRRFSFSLQFDYERIDELQEAWWPLRITGILHSVSGLDHQCYYHRENCD